MESTVDNSIQEFDSPTTQQWGNDKNITLQYFAKEKNVENNPYRRQARNMLKYALGQASTSKDFHMVEEDSDESSAALLSQLTFDCRKTKKSVLPVNKKQYSLDADRSQSSKQISNRKTSEVNEIHINVENTTKQICSNEINFGNGEVSTDGAQSKSISENDASGENFNLESNKKINDLENETSDNIFEFRSACCNEDANSSEPNLRVSTDDDDDDDVYEKPIEQGQKNIDSDTVNSKDPMDGDHSINVLTYLAHNKPIENRAVPTKDIENSKQSNNTRIQKIEKEPTRENPQKDTESSSPIFKLQSDVNIKELCENTKGLVALEDYELYFNDNKNLNDNDIDLAPFKTIEDLKQRCEKCGIFLLKTVSKKKKNLVTACQENELEKCAVLSFECNVNFKTRGLIPIADYLLDKYVNIEFDLNIMISDEAILDSFKTMTKEQFIKHCNNKIISLSKPAQIKPSCYAEAESNKCLAINDYETNANLLVEDENIKNIQNFIKATEKDTNIALQLNAIDEIISSSNSQITVIFNNRNKNQLQRKTSVLASPLRKNRKNQRNKLNKSQADQAYVKKIINMDGTSDLEFDLSQKIINLPIRKKLRVHSKYK